MTRNNSANYDIKPMKLNSKAMRAMQPGDVLIFDCGVLNAAGAFMGATSVSSLASRAGMQIAQRQIIVVDPISYETTPAIMVLCLQPARPPQPRGRKPTQTSE